MSKHSKYAVVELDIDNNVEMFILEGNKEIEKFINDNNLILVSEDYEPSCWSTGTENARIYLDEFHTLEEAKDWISLYRRVTAQGYRDPDFSNSNLNDPDFKGSNLAKRSEKE